ncbi:MAG: hypothetical protein ACMUHY_05765 [Thermoplasmatota archaeon]
MGSDGNGRTGPRYRYTLVIPILISGIVYLAASLVHFIRFALPSLQLWQVLNVPSDVISGGILLLTGSLLIMGGLRMSRGRREGLAFTWVGWMVGVLLSSVSALVLLSNAFSSVVLSSDDLAGWTAADDTVPALYIGVLQVILLPIIVKVREVDVPKEEGGEEP